MKNTFLHIVKEVLTRDQFVTLPGLGSFIVKEINSTINPVNGEIKPRHSSIVFNSKIIEDDGILSSQYKSFLNISYKDAQETLNSEIQVLIKQLKDKKYFAFSPLGNFFFNENSGIFFVPRAQNNINTQSFGLKPLKWVSSETKINNSTNVINEAPSIEIEDVNVVEIDNEKIQSSEKSNNSNLFWRIAANFVLISITFATLYTSSVTWIRLSKENNILASHFFNQEEKVPIAIKSKETESAEVINSPKDNFVFINGKLVSLNKNTSADNSNTQIVSFDKFRGQIKEQSGNYFIVGGSYLTSKAAELECRNWNNLGINATFIRVKGSSLNRIVIQRFSSAKEASDYLVNLKDTPKVPVGVHELTLQ